MAKVINGEIYKNMVISAAAALEQRKEEINDLNVFPVPDGDTGTNMSMTFANAAKELSVLDKPTLGRALDVASSALLRGARGNSGVILSLIFRGMGKSMKDLSTADGKQLAQAIAEGADTAYAAVMKPAEGTMLTVCRKCGEAGIKAAKKNTDAEYVLSVIIEAGKKALEETIFQNPVLEKAGVVDAGAFGLLIAFGGMQLVLSGKMAQFAAKFMPTSVKSLSAEGADFSQFDSEEITFAYCTEFIIEIENREKSISDFRVYLDTIGDSVVVVNDDDIIKVHVHTDTPDRALGEALKFGGLSNVKIENMVEQLNRNKKNEMRTAIGKRESAKPTKKYGFVAVAAGEGIVNVFKDLGVDSVVEGGQTMNPSTDDLLRAVDATPVEIVYLLPNNKNIIMAGEQVADLSEKQVIVIPSKTVPQGIAALIDFDADKDKEYNEQAMKQAAAHVATGLITYAARDSDFDGKPINKGDYLGLSENSLVISDSSFELTAKSLAANVCREDSSYITIFVGEDAAPEQTEQLESIIQEASRDAEITVIPGGQPVYSYIISVE